MHSTVCEKAVPQTESRKSLVRTAPRTFLTPSCWLGVLQKRKTDSHHRMEGSCVDFERPSKTVPAFIGRVGEVPINDMKKKKKNNQKNSTKE